MHPCFQCVGERSLNQNKTQSFSPCLYYKFPPYLYIYCKSDSPNVNGLYLVLQKVSLSILGLLLRIYSLAMYLRCTCIYIQIRANVHSLMKHKSQSTQPPENICKFPIKLLHCSQGQRQDLLKSSGKAVDRNVWQSYVLTNENVLRA